MHLKNLSAKFLGFNALNVNHAIIHTHTFTVLDDTHWQHHRMSHRSMSPPPPPPPQHTHTHGVDVGGGGVGWMWGEDRVGGMCVCVCVWEGGYPARFLGEFRCVLLCTMYELTKTSNKGQYSPNRWLVCCRRGTSLLKGTSIKNKLFCLNHETCTIIIMVKLA